jgi:hypothetical protein
MDHYFKIKTSVGNYLRKKRGQIYWYFVKFRKHLILPMGKHCGLKYEDMGGELSK